jgi:putative tryptophan/tyrosine transport system substrate-binding protein
MWRTTSLITMFAALSLMITASATVIAQSNAAQDQSPPVVGVTSITFSAEIQAVVDGMRDRLAERGFRPGQTVNYIVRDAGADGGEIANVVRDFASQNVHIIVAITTPSIQAALANKNRIPIVAAGLSAMQARDISNQHRRRAVTGISDGDTREDQFSLIDILAPEIRSVAIPVDPERGPIASQIQDLTALARGHDLSIIPLPVSIGQNAVGAEINTLDPELTAILLDRAVLPDAPVEALSAAAKIQNLRLFGTDEDSVIRGALAALVIEPHGIGQQLGDLVADVLETPSSAKRPFERARASHLVFNEDGRAVLDVAAIEKALAGRRRSVIDWAEDASPRPRLKPAIPAAPPPLGVVRGITVPIPRSKPPRP